jgi:hypothetical protein
MKFAQPGSLGVELIHQELNSMNLAIADGTTTDRFSFALPNQALASWGEEQRQQPLKHLTSHLIGQEV